MNILKTTMGLLILAVFFFTAHEPAHAACTVYTTEFGDVDIGAEPDGVCLESSFGETYNFTDDVDEDSDTGIAIVVAPSVLFGNVNILEGVTVTAEFAGILGGNGEDYVIDGTIDAGGTGLFVVGDSGIYANSIDVTETGAVHGGVFGIAAFKGNEIRVAGVVTGGIAGLYLGNENATLITTTGSVQGEMGAFMLGEGNLLEVEGSLSGTHIGARAFTGMGTPPSESNNVIIVYKDGIIEATGSSAAAESCVDAPNFLPCPTEKTVYAIHIDESEWNGSTTVIENYGTIRALTPEDGSYAAMAIHDSEGILNLTAYDGSVIDGDIHTGANDDIITLMAGSTVNGNIDMGRTENVGQAADQYIQVGDGTDDFYLDEDGEPQDILDEDENPVDFITQDEDSGADTFGDEILVPGSDYEHDFDVDPDTGEKVVRLVNLIWVPGDAFVAIEDDPMTVADESLGGTAYTLVVGGNDDPAYDSGVDYLILGDTLNSEDSDHSITNVGHYDGDITEVEILVKTGASTWTLGGTVTIDGQVLINSETGEVSTLATTITNGRLNINGTLTSPNVIVMGGATLGGTGEIVTDPGTDGGNGGVILSGLVQDEVAEPLFVDVSTTPEERAAFLELNGLPDKFVGETFDGGNFQTSDSLPTPARLAPGNSIGTLNVVGNVFLLDQETATTTYVVSGIDDRITQDPDTAEPLNVLGPDGTNDFEFDGDDPVDLLDSDMQPYDLATQDEFGDPVPQGGDGITDFDLNTVDSDTVQVDHIYEDFEIDGREVVTEWGSVFEAELDQDGNNDLLNVTKSGSTSAIVATVHPGHEDEHEGHDLPHTTYAAQPVPDGVAFLGGALDIVLAPGAYNDGHVHDIIIAEGGVEGVFQSIGFAGGGNDGAVLLGHDLDGAEIRVQVFKGFLEYMPDRVRITSIPGFEIHGETHNQKRIGHYIDGMTLFGVHQDPLQGSFAALGQVGDIPLALDWMTPEFFDPYNSVALTLSHGVVDTIIDRVYATHHGVSTNLTSVGNGYANDTSVGASDSGNKFVFWAGGNWNSAKVSDDGGGEDFHDRHIEYDYDTLVGYIGGEYVWQGHGMAGIVASFGNTDLDYEASSASSGDVDHWSISGYGSYFITDNAHVTAGGGHGSLDIETTREDALDHMTRADYDGDYTFFFAEVSSSYNVGGDWKLTPSLDVTSTKVKQDGFAETGDSPFALEVDAQSNKSLRGAVRARLAHDWKKDMGHLMAYLAVGVAHEFKDGHHVLQARFVGDDGNFTSWGQGFHGTTALVGVGMTAILNDTWAIEAHYNGEFGSSYDNHGISLNVNAAF